MLNRFRQSIGMWLEWSEVSYRGRDGMGPADLIGLTGLVGGFNF